MPVAAGERLSGKMWWNDETAPGFLSEFVLFPDSFHFTVKAEGWLYQGRLRHLDGINYKGPFSFSGGTGIAGCTLVQNDGEYRLAGKWQQSDSVETFDWNAVLERS
jgi:hypothetical protein